MNYGSIGYISEDFTLTYSKEIYSAFSLSDRSVLYGLYYPCPDMSKDELYKDVTLKHDFILTPIPFKLWKASARLQVFLKNAPGTLNELYGYLKEKRVSVIHSESTRSSYRYATWSVHIVFEEILELAEKSELTYSEELRCYEETEKAVKDFINELIEDKKDCLYSLHRQKPVKGTTNYALAYFDYYYKTQFQNKKYAFEPFELRMHSADGIHRRQTLLGNDAFKNIMTLLTKEERELLPATTFSELDTSELNLRTTIISAENVKRFFKVSIKYNRQGKKDTCVGIVHTITDRMPSQYTIWHSYNRVINNNQDAESGELVFLIEDISFFLMRDARQIRHIKDRGERDNRDANSYQIEAFNHFEYLIKDHNSNKNDDDLSERIEFRKLVVSPMPNAGVMREILLLDSIHNDYRDFEYDLFISYSHKDRNYVMNEFIPVLEEKKISYHLDVKEIESGQRLDDSLLKNIKNSREMCVIVSAHTAKSEWMVIERGAAWILDKTITPIKIDDKGEDVPELLHMRVYVNGQNPRQNIEAKQAIIQYAENVISRRNRSSAKKYIGYFVK